jgi:copper(I)-binding protein
VFWNSRASGSPRRLLIVAAAALLPVLAGCEAGNNAPTLDWHQPTPGAGTQFRDIAIRNVFVLGPPSLASLPPGASASLFFALVNTGRPDRLISVQAPGTAAAVTIAGSTIRLGTSQAVLLTGPQPKAVLTGLTRTVTSGSTITLILSFQRAGSITMQVPVLAMMNAYSTFSPPATPTPTATPGKHHHAAAPSPSATGTAAVPASATPSPSASSSG